MTGADSWVIDREKVAIDPSPNWDTPESDTMSRPWTGHLPRKAVYATDVVSPSVAITRLSRTCNAEKDHATKGV